jgi:hypothetical protein
MCGLEAEKIADLRARDDHGDAVREADHHRARDVIDGGAQSGRAEDDQHDARHERAHEQPVDAVMQDDSGHHDDERSRGAADLGPGSAERRDQESRDDGAVDAGLRRHARGDGERHGQGERHEPHRDSGDQVVEEVAARIAAEAEDGLRKPGGEP